MTRKQILKRFNLGDIPEFGLIMELLTGKGSAVLNVDDNQGQTEIIATSDSVQFENMEEIHIDPNETEQVAAEIVEEVNNTTGS